MRLQACCPCEAAAQPWRLTAGLRRQRCGLVSFQASAAPDRHLRCSAIPPAAAADGSGGQPSGSRLQRQQQQAPLPPYAAWPGTARVALRTGVYIAILGLALFLLPASVFGAVFDASRVSAGWVRVGGVLAALFGAYYVGAAMDDAEGREPRHLYTSTVAGRLLLSAAFCWLVATRQCEFALLWLAAANAASSALLWRAVRQRRRAEAARGGGGGEQQASFA